MGIDYSFLVVLGCLEGEKERDRGRGSEGGGNGVSEHRVVEWWCVGEGTAVRAGGYYYSAVRYSAAAATATGYRINNLKYDEGGNWEQKTFSSFS